MTDSRGYDAVCHGCRASFTFKNAQAVGTDDWEHYCSKLCQQRASAQGCELATDATKQLGEHSVHLAAPQNAEDFRRRPASSEAAPSAEGSELVLVPREPTEAMLDAGAKHIYEPTYRNDLERIWSAMLAASGLPASGRNER